MATGQSDVTQLHSRLVDLSAKQSELRQSLAKYLIDHADVTLASISTKTGVHTRALKSFLEKNSSITHGKGLLALCNFLGRPELGFEISQLDELIPDRYLAYASCDENTIDLGMKILTAFSDNADKTSFDEFSEAFGDLSSIVLGILNSSVSSIKLLTEPRNEVAITTVIGLGFEERLEEIRRQTMAKKQRQASRLAEVITPLIERFGDKTRLSEALGIHSDTLRNALRGQSGWETTEKLILNAKKLADQNHSPLPKKTPKTSSVASSKPLHRSQPATKVIPDSLAKVGGSTTQQGVEFVLTEADFQEVSGVPLLALRDSLMESIRVTRLLLNIGSQLKDDQARDILQEDVGSEIKELYLAIKTFTFAHPNEVLSLYDGQREHWLKNAQAPTPRRRSK